MSGLAFDDTTPTETELGKRGDRCRTCGFELAADQRYCVNCGTRRASARVDYRTLLADDDGANAGSSTARGAAPAAASAPVAETRAVSPLGAAVALGLVLLAVMLGAVIGKGAADSSKPVVVGGSQARAQSTPAATTPTTTSAATTAKKSTSSGSQPSAGQGKNAAVTKQLQNASGNAYSQKSTELKGLIATGGN